MSVNLCCIKEPLLTLSLLAVTFLSADTFANSLDPDSGHSDSVPEIIFENVNFEKSQQMTTKA